MLKVLPATDRYRRVSKSATESHPVTWTYTEAVGMVNSLACPKDTNRARPQPAVKAAARERPPNPLLPSDQPLLIGPSKLSPKAVVGIGVRDFGQYIDQASANRNLSMSCPCRLRIRSTGLYSRQHCLN